MLPTKTVLFFVVFIATVIMGPLLIPLLKKLKFRQTVRDDGPDSHLKKMGTPTMGGLLFLIPMLSVGAMYARYEPKIWSLVLVTAGFAFVGFLDDFLKIIRRSKDGLKPLQKMIGLLAIATAFAIYISRGEGGTETVMPILGFYNPINFGIWYIPFVMFVLVGTSNAVNITDGLDGLAAGVTFFVSLFLGVVALMQPQSEYIHFFTVALCAGCLGFLVFNIHPAKVFMGDTGSLALGGAIGAIAILLKIPFLLVVVGLIYVIEVVSVMLQVGSFRLRKKRIFKMAPFHHHLELSGWRETNVVFTFWGLTFLFSLVGLYLLRIDLFGIFSL